MISYLGSLAVQSCCGEGGALQADVAVCGEHSPCSGVGSRKFWRPLPLCGAPFPSAASGSGSQRLGCPLPGCGAFSLLCEQPRQPEACAPSPRARRAFSLRGPSARRRSGLRKSLDGNRGLFAGWEGVASLGLSLPPSPPPCLLPPAGMGRLFSGVSQSLCFANRRRCVPAG